VSEDSSQSNYSYLYEAGGPSSILMIKAKKKDQSKKVTEYKNKRVQTLLKEVISETFIHQMCEFFPTKELVARIRPLNKVFNNNVKSYLPNRLQ